MVGYWHIISMHTFSKNIYANMYCFYTIKITNKPLNKVLLSVYLARYSSGQQGWRSEQETKLSALWSSHSHDNSTSWRMQQKQTWIRQEKYGLCPNCYLQFRKSLNVTEPQYSHLKDRDTIPINRVTVRIK